PARPLRRAVRVAGGWVPLILPDRGRPARSCSPGPCASCTLMSELEARGPHERAGRPRSGKTSARQHRLADDLRAVHETAQAFVEGVEAVHDAAVVPHDGIADSPRLVPGEALLSGVRPDRVEQLLALLDAEAVDVGARPAAEEQGFTLGDRMQADEGMYCARRLGDVVGGLEALA